jgi:hypothetical protein
MRTISVGCGLALLLMTPSFAQDARTWLLDDSTDQITLQYGTPESDDVVIAVTCEPKAKTMKISEFVGAENLVPGRPARLKLVNGTATLDYAGLAVANEIDGNVNVEVSMRVDPKLFALLKTGQSLLLEVAGKQATIPLKGVTEHLGTFERACLGRR